MKGSGCEAEPMAKAKSGSRMETLSRVTTPKIRSVDQASTAGKMAPRKWGSMWMVLSMGGTS